MLENNTGLKSINTELQSNRKVISTLMEKIATLEAILEALQLKVTSQGEALDTIING